MLGTLKAPRYCVLRDECCYHPNVLALFTYWYSFLFCRCVTPVSVPPPVFYAHLAAARGRLLRGMEDDPFDSDTASISSDASELINLTDAQCQTLFYV